MKLGQAHVEAGVGGQLGVWRWDADARDCWLTGVDGGDSVHVFGCAGGSCWLDGIEYGHVKARLLRRDGDEAARTGQRQAICVHLDEDW